MAELVYAHDSKSCGETHVGSIPTVGTIQSIALENFLNWMQNECRPSTASEMDEQSFERGAQGQIHLAPI